MIRRVLITAIILYQKTLSPDHGLFKAKYPQGFCRFYPSCSEYAKLSIDRYGPLRGVLLAIRRIVRCNPFSQPRVDMPN